MLYQKLCKDNKQIHSITSTGHCKTIRMVKIVASMVLGLNRVVDDLQVLTTGLSTTQGYSPQGSKWREVTMRVLSVVRKLCKVEAVDDSSSSVTAVNKSLNYPCHRLRVTKRAIAKAS